MSLLTRQLEAVPPNAHSLNVSPKKIGLVSYLRRLCDLGAACVTLVNTRRVVRTYLRCTLLVAIGLSSLVSPVLLAVGHAQDPKTAILWRFQGLPKQPIANYLGLARITPEGITKQSHKLYAGSEEFVKSYATKKLQTYYPDGLDANGGPRPQIVGIKMQKSIYDQLMSESKQVDLEAHGPGGLEITSDWVKKLNKLIKDGQAQVVSGDEFLATILDDIKREGIKQVEKLPTTITFNSEASAGTTPNGACAAAKAGIGTTIVGAGVNVASGAVVNSAVTAGLSGLGFNPIDIAIATSLAGPLTGEVTGLTGAMVAQNVPGLAGRVLQAGFGSSSTYFAGGGLTAASALAIPLTGWSTTAQIALTTSEQWNAAAAASLNDGNLGAARYYSDLAERAASYAGLGVLDVALDDWAAAANAPGPIPDYIPFAKDINVRVNLAREGWYWACQIFDRR